MPRDERIATRTSPTAIEPLAGAGLVSTRGIGARQRNDDAEPITQWEVIDPGTGFPASPAPGRAVPKPCGGPCPGRETERIRHVRAPTRGTRHHRHEAVDG